jgi:hypothetical protein
VVDISVMRTTVIETGNWVIGDLDNGRVVHVPNSRGSEITGLQLFPGISIYLGMKSRSTSAPGAITSTPDKCCCGLQKKPSATTW